MTKTEESFTIKKFAELDFYRRVNTRLVDMADPRPGETIVDLACGTGMVSRLLLEKLRNARDTVIIAIDHSAAALRQAIADLGNARDGAIRFIQSKGEKLSEAVHSRADRIFLCNAIHYFKDKDNLVSEVSQTLKPGGVFAFNTAYFQGSQPPETEQFYRRWMFKAMRILHSQGLNISKEEKVEPRRMLTAEQYTDLLKRHGFAVSRQEIEAVPMPVEGWASISQYEDFAHGALPGVPLEKATEILKQAVSETYQELGLKTVRRNWLEVVAVKVPAPA